MAGDVCPGQLIVEGTPENHGALPALDGCAYAKARGSNPGHKVGWRLAQHGLDASRGRLERKWLGHLVQTTNHWANIQTSYAILEFIIIPWLLDSIQFNSIQFKQTRHGQTRTPGPGQTAEGAHI